MLCVTDLILYHVLKRLEGCAETIVQVQERTRGRSVKQLFTRFCRVLQRWSKTDLNASTLSIMINNLQVIILNKIIIDMMGYDTEYTTEK